MISTRNHSYSPRSINSSSICTAYCLYDDLTRCSNLLSSSSLTMTKSKSTRHPPTPTSSTVEEDIPLSEQIRLAQASGILPAGSLRHPSSIRNRRPVKEPLVDRIPATAGGARIEEITLGDELDEDEDDQAETTDHHEEDDRDDQDEDDRSDLELDPSGPWNPQTAENVTKIPTGIKRPSPGHEDTPELDLSDEVFITIMYLIPLASLYLLFDLSVHLLPSVVMAHLIITRSGTELKNVLFLLSSRTYASYPLGSCRISLAHMSFNRNPGPMHYVKRLSTAVPSTFTTLFLCSYVRYRDGTADRDPVGRGIAIGILVFLSRSSSCPHYLCS